MLTSLYCVQLELLMIIQTINPATEALLNRYTCLNEYEINQKLDNSAKAQALWRHSSFVERTIAMTSFMHLLDKHRVTLARLMSLEMGKPVSAAQAEINKCILLCQHYITHSEEYLSPRSVCTEMKRATVCYQPLGVIFGIMPWNFPVWQVLRFAVPTIMAGNAAVLKHAPICSGVGNELERLFHDAGFPEHLFQHVIVDNDGAAQIIAHQHVAAVTLTGSCQAGSSVASLAGAHLKKSVLELGGCDPYVILDDADLDLAAQSIVTSRLSNTGQVCIAAKRVIAVSAIAEELLTRIQQHISTFVIGDPLDPETTMGPMARKDLREQLHIQVMNSVKQGAKLLCGGIIPQGKGFYYPPTVLTNVYPGMVAFDEELFGPVIALSVVASEEEAIVYANKNQYGLSAAVFTQDLARGERIAREAIEAGVCFVNSYVVSDPRLPFGGTKRSGYGRELSREGILEFVNTKTIVVNG